MRRRRDHAQPARQANALSRALIAGFARVRGAADDPQALRDPHRRRARSFAPAWTSPSCRNARRRRGSRLGRLAQTGEALRSYLPLPKPTIAAVNGAAVAGGAGLVTVATWRVPSRRRSSAIPKSAAAGWRRWSCRTCFGTSANAWRGTLLLDRRTHRRRRGPAGGTHQSGSCGIGASVSGAGGLAKSSEGGPNALAKTKDLLQKCSRQSLTMDEFAPATPSCGWATSARSARGLLRQEAKRRGFPRHSKMSEPEK